MPTGCYLHPYKHCRYNHKVLKSGEYVPHLTHVHDELVFLLKTRERLLETLANAGHLLCAHSEGVSATLTRDAHEEERTRKNKLAAESLTADMYRYFVLEEEATQPC